MYRHRVFVVAALLLFSGSILGQIPPGVSYDSARHPNAILTYVTNEDFVPVAYSEARDAGDIELLALSQDEGKRESIALAALANRTRKIRILGRDVEVFFYPVIRQTFTLTAGGQLVLHSFKFPRTSIPVPDEVLHEAAFEKTKNPEEGRFGLSPIPEEIEVRRGSGLLFEDGEQRTIFWVEQGVVHTAEMEGPTDELLWLIDDSL
jgi:hypothetical protein